MAWIVLFSNKARKQKEKLPEIIREILSELAKDIRENGPVRGDWPNYGKLGRNRHHCHLRKGSPTYVAVWTEDRDTITVEITYAGTHEKAPY